MLSGSYGNRNGCFSYWHSSRFNNDFLTLTEYLHKNEYYTHADVHSDIVLPSSGFDEYQVFDESLVDLKQRHSNLIEKMKTKNEDDQNFFLYLHYQSIHTGMLNSVLKTYNNYSKEYFENRKLNEKRYDDLFRGAEEYIEMLTKKITDFNLFHPFRGMCSVYFQNLLDTMVHPDVHEHAIPCRRGLLENNSKS